MPLARDDAETLRSLIEYCNDYTEKLSQWERSFVESVGDQLERNGMLSDKQKEVLERIYCKLP